MSSKTQFALICCLLITAILGLGVVSATDNTNLTDTNDIISSESSSSNVEVINDNNNEFKELNTNTEIKKIDKNTKENTKLNANDNSATTITVNNYAELYDQVIYLRNQGTATSYTLNLNTKGDYTITDTLIWGTYNGPARYLTINGNGVTIDGKGSKSFLTVNANYTVTLNNLNIINNYRTNVSGGGAIFANGDLTVNNCNFTNCKTVDSPGHTNTHGGAIRASNSKLTIKNSIFKQNSATAGAGAVVMSTTTSLSPNTNVTTIKPTLIITNSQFISNNAEHGAAINIEEYIAANITGCTFTSNKAIDGAGINTDERAYLISTNNKFTNNIATKSGAAIYNGINSTAKVVNNTFTNNQAVYGTSIVNQEGSTLIVSDSTFTNNKANGTNAGGGAIHNTKKVTASVDKCTFNDNHANVYGGVISNVENNKLTITNSKFNNNTVNKFGGAIYNNNKNTVTITNTNFTSNTAETVGGVIANINDNKLTITNTKFNNNIAKQNGGVIFNQNKTTMTIKDSTFTSNTATTNGGVIYSVSYSNITATNATFNNNKATAGAAIFNGNETNLTLINSQINNNNASSYGAIANVEKNTLTITNTKFNNNIANKFGGAIYNNNKNTLTIKDSTFASNTAETGGGAIANINDNKLTITNTKFNNNIAKTNGGGIFNQNKTTMTIKYSTFTSNTATTNGGALYAGGNSTITTTNATFNNNKATLGGAICNLAGSTVTVINSQFTNNTASNTGYAIFNPAQATLILKGNNQFNPFDDKNTIKNNGNQKNETVNTKINIKSIEGTSEVSVKGLLTDEYNYPIANVNVAVKFGSKSQTVKTDANGNYIADFTGITSGTYNVSATFNKNSLYNSSSANTTKTINVPTPGNSSNAKIFITSMNVLNSKYVLTTKIVDDKFNKVETGRVSYRLDGKWIGTINVNGGSSWISFNVPAVGNHTIVATYINTDNKEISSDTYTFEKMVKVNSLFNQYNVKNGKVIIVTALRDDNGGNITGGRVSYNLDNKWIGSIDVKNSQSWISFNYTNTTPTFKATYIADSGAKQNIYSRVLNLSLMNGMANGNTTPKNDTPTKNSSVHIMINSINVLNGKYVLTTKVTDDKYKLLNVGRVSYTLDGKWIGSIDVSKGSSWISFNVPAVGNHTIIATYLDTSGKKITSDTYSFEKIAKVNALWNAYNVKNGKVIVTVAVKYDTGANVNSGRVSYNFNGKWIGSIDVKNGSSWISFNYANTTSTFKATFITSSGVTQNIFTRTLDLEEISKIKTAT